MVRQGPGRINAWAGMCGALPAPAKNADAVEIADARLLYVLTHHQSSALIFIEVERAHRGGYRIRLSRSRLLPFLLPNYTKQGGT